MTSVNRKMATGIAWMSLMRIGIKLLGLVNTVVLARLLVPADFGLVAMAMSVIAGLELFRAFNFDIALIQRQEIDRSHYDTAWTFNIFLGFALALILVLIAVPAAHFYSEPRLTHVMEALALGVSVSGFENVGVVAFRRELSFYREFGFRIAQKICTVLITLPLAFALRSYWALVIGMVSASILGVAISYFVHPFRPRVSFSARRDLLSFSKWLLATNALWFVRDRTPDYVLGRVAGAGVLGLFTVSLEISNLPTTELIAPINRAVLPGYSRMAHDLGALRDGFIDVIGLVIVLALPAGFGIAATSDLIVNVALGAKWSAASPAISILGIFGAINALQTNCGAVHYAMGRPKIVTVVGALQVAVLVPAVIWSAMGYGAIGVAWAYLAVVSFIVPLNYVIVLYRLRLHFRRVWAVVWRPIVATSVMYAVTRDWVSTLTELSIRNLLVAVAIGALSYFVTVAMLWMTAGRPVGPERMLTDKVLLPTWRRLVS